MRTALFAIAAGIASAVGLGCFYRALALGHLGTVTAISASGAVIPVIVGVVGGEAISLIGAIGAALTVGLRGAGVLLSLLVLPLCIPVLIFGAGAVEAHIAGLGIAGHFSLLGALLVLSVTMAPLVASAALRIALE
jgi:heme exporter protein B